jgi:large subunit ribosomal protein L16
MKAFNPPRIQKRAKRQKGRIGGKESNQFSSSFGRYAIVSLECKRISCVTIEAVRRILTRFLERKGEIRVSIYPDIAVTKKPVEMRMGKGKGAISDWVFRVKTGQNLFEIDGVPESLAKEASLRASYRLPTRTRFHKYDT